MNQSILRRFGVVATHFSATGGRTGGLASGWGGEAEHCPGDQLAPSIKLVSNTVTSGVRTVVMTRSFVGTVD